MFAQRMRRVALVGLLLAATGLQAAEVAGVKIDDKLRVGDSELVLNGAGLRSRFFIKVYVGALYVGQKSNAPAAIINSASPRRMSLRMLRELDSDALYGALQDGLKSNLTAAELAEIKPQSDELAAIMKGIGKVREGDAIAMDFSADGVGIGLNGEARGKVAGAVFARSLLKVWLGENPVEASLKKALLGD
ncbi:MAG: chalcone isomerase family protein [Rhodocyclaceae bacterium]|nr:chalcone isomerase family protein [Rhodocyclaceae bacterium]